jgi:uncharacterized protein
VLRWVQSRPGPLIVSIVANATIKVDELFAFADILRMKDTKEFMAAEAVKLNGAAVGIPTRNLQFKHPADVPRYFAYNGSVVGTTLKAVFSAIFPPGERYFVESVRRFRDQITDPVLKAKITGFIGQESIHGREHEHLNDWFIARDFHLAVPEGNIQFSLWLCEQFSPTQQLACTALMEHFTAHLAEEWLTHEDFRGSTHAEMLKLWTWHGIEELEHKEVAYDVLQLVSKNEHLERMLAVPIVVAALLPGILGSWAYLIAREGKLFDLPRNLSDLWALFKPGGFLTNVLVKMPQFLLKDFHPNDRDTRALVERYRNEYFAENGTVSVEFKNREACARAAN